MSGLEEVSGGGNPAFGNGQELEQVRVNFASGMTGGKSDGKSRVGSFDSDAVRMTFSWVEEAKVNFAIWV